LNKENEMKEEIGRIRKTRSLVIKLISDLSIEQLNEIPLGFNNNIAWNFAHLLASQQGLCYIRAGLKPIMDEKFIATYKGGTKPERHIDEKEIEHIKEQFLLVMDQLEKDYENNLFSNYQAFTTALGVGVNTIDEAISFLFFHEGLHTGYIMALKRLVRDN
jgi:hypothetical protein